MTILSDRPSQSDYAAPHAPRQERIGRTVVKWITSTDHKTIGYMYLITSMIFFGIAGVMALLMRAELMRPGLQFLNNEQYNQLFTMHGTIMVFFVLTSSFTSETGIDINKPKAQSSKTLPKQPLLIGITRDGSIHVNESPVNIKALQGVLQHYISEDPNRAVVVVADRDALISKAVDVLDACNLANVKKVSISTLKE